MERHGGLGWAHRTPRMDIGIAMGAHDPRTFIMATARETSVDKNLYMEYICQYCFILLISCRPVPMLSAHLSSRCSPSPSPKVRPMGRVEPELLLRLFCHGCSQSDLVALSSPPR